MREIMKCPKCKKNEVDQIYGLCEDCWEDYVSWSWWSIERADGDWSVESYIKEAV